MNPRYLINRYTLAGSSLGFMVGAFINLLNGQKAFAIIVIMVAAVFAHTAAWLVEHEHEAAQDLFGWADEQKAKRERFQRAETQREVEFWHFWNPNSGLVGGLIGAAIMLLLCYLLWVII